MLEGCPENLKKAVEQLKDNMLVALVKRAGGVVSFTVEEMDEANEKVWLDSDPHTGTFMIKLDGKKGA